MLFVAYNYTFYDFELSGFENAIIDLPKPKCSDDIKRLERAIKAQRNAGKDRDAGEGIDSVTILSFQEL